MLVAVGATIGTGTALVGSRLVSNQLLGVQPGDPTAIAAAILVLLAVTAAAACIPARRASRIHPVTALRTE